MEVIQLRSEVSHLTTRLEEREAEKVLTKQRAVGCLQQTIIHHACAFERGRARVRMRARACLRVEIFRLRTDLEILKNEVQEKDASFDEERRQHLLTRQQLAAKRAAAEQLASKAVGNLREGAIGHIIRIDEDGVPQIDFG